MTPEPLSIWLPLWLFICLPQYSGAAIKPTIIDSVTSTTYFISGTCQVENRGKDGNTNGDITIAKQDNKVIYLQFSPKTKGATTHSEEEWLLYPDHKIYIIGKGRYVPSDAVPAEAYVSPVHDTSGLSPNFEPLNITYVITALRELRELTLQQEHQKIEDYYVYYSQLNHNDENCFRFEYSFDAQDRITSVSKYWNFAGKPPFVIGPLYQFGYDDKMTTFPREVDIHWIAQWPSHRRHYMKFDKIEFRDVGISEFEPTLLETGMMVTDSRFTPPLRYESKGTAFPTDDELFAMAAKDKSERIAQNNRQAQIEANRIATVDNPRNIKDAPLTKESWGKRLRTIPNWVYGGAIAVVFVGWIVSKRRKN